MKQDVVPTSPKSHHRQKADEKRSSKQASAPRWKLIVAVAVISVAFGTLAGLLGFVAAASIPSEWPVIGRVNIVDLFEKERDETLLAVRRSERSLLEQSPNVIAEVASVYAAAPTIDQPSNLLGNAVVATADGWLIVASEILPEEGEPVVIFSDGSVATIEQRLEDPLTGITYIRVDARNLDVANFSGNTLISVGQTLSVVEKHIGSVVVYERRVAGEVLRTNTVRATNRMDQYTMLDPVDAASRISSAVFGNGGEFLGLTVQSGVMIPAAVLNGALQGIIANSAIERSTAHIEYMNTARLTDEQKTARALPERGIYIVDVKDQGSNAESTDEVGILQPGDSITGINSVPVTEFTDLSTVIHSKPKGTTFYFQVERDGETQTINWKS